MKNLKKNSRSEQQFNKMCEAEELNLCPFCSKGLKKIHKLPIEKETTDFFVTKNAFPYEGTLAHYLIIPKKHLKYISELNSDMWIQIGELFNWLTEKPNTQSGGFFIRFGDLHRTGSSIEHLHFQVISGSKSDTSENKKSLKIKFGYK